MPSPSRRRSRIGRRLAALLALVVGAYLPAWVAASSEPGSYPSYVDGWVLGASSTDAIVPDSSGFPANPAFLVPLELEVSGGANVALTPHPTLAGAYQPPSPLDAGAHTLVSPADPSLSIVIGSTGVVDELAPVAPVVTQVEYFQNGSAHGCGGGTPGGGVDSPQLLVHLDPLQDDGTPAGRLTLAFHPGASAAEAGSTEQRFLVVMDTDGTALIPASEPWLSVSAIDLAGNESPRSAAFTY